jgi:hypothetical protein
VNECQEDKNHRPHVLLPTRLQEPRILSVSCSGRAERPGLTIREP